MVQQSIVFASRAGQQTLERGYLWWYVLRPVWSALLGGVVVLTVNAGLVSIGDPAAEVRPGSRRPVDADDPAATGGLNRTSQP
jgi:hypothetical protein